MIRRSQHNSNNDQMFYLKLLTRINQFQEIEQRSKRKTEILQRSISLTKIADHKFYFYFKVLSRFEPIQESDDFVKHSIDNLLGLAIPDYSFQLKI